MSLLLFFALQAHAQEVLPLERIRFYETGVAYFQRSGTVSRATTLPVPMAHLDDALKTLVVLSEDAEVGAITFPSAVSDEAARVMAGLDHNASPVGFADALRSLQGLEVALRHTDGSQLTAVLLDVAGPLPRAEGDTESSRVLPAEYALTLLDEKGGVLRTTTESVASVRPLADDISSRLHQAAQTMATGHARRSNGLALQLWKPGTLGLGYIAESPVWRVSYRILLARDAPAQLQAWALIHNDTDEDWEEVAVELANGEPDSFLFPMASPRYVARELVTPEVALSSVPQLATETPDAMWDAGTTISGSGYGSGSGSFSGSGAGMSGRSLGGIGVLAQLKEAEPVETPTQFIYKVARSVDLAAHHSALVPLVQGEIDAERTVVFAPDSGAGRNGIWVTNDTARTLPDGVAAIFEADGLAGEGSISRLKPEENQMVLFGNERDVAIERSGSTAPQSVRSVVWSGEWLQVENVRPSAWQVAVHNRTQRPQSLWYALALGPQESFVGDIRQEIDPSRGWTYAVFDVAPGSQEVALHTERLYWEQRLPASVSSEEYLAWAEADLHPQIFRAAAEARQALQHAEDAVARLRAEQGSRSEQIKSLRDDMYAAQGAEGTQLLTRKIANLEQDVRKQQPVLARLVEKRDAATEALVAILEALAAGS